MFYLIVPIRILIEFGINDVTNLSHYVHNWNHKI